MSKKGKNNVMVLGLDELQNGVDIAGETPIHASKNTPIPIESLKILMTGDSNDKFRVLSKKITSKDVKLVLKHRETGEQVKIVAPIDFLEFHHIPYKHLQAPNNHQIEGVLNKKVRQWECKIIIPDLHKEFDLVVVLDKESGKTIACKVPKQEIEQAALYIEKSKTYAQAKDYNFEKINHWRENEWQREIMTKINLLKLTRSTTPIALR